MFALIGATPMCRSGYVIDSVPYEANGIDFAALCRRELTICLDGQHSRQSRHIRAMYAMLARKGGSP